MEETRCLQDPTVPKGHVLGTTFSMPMIPVIYSEEEGPQWNPHSFTAVFWDIHKGPLLEERKECLRYVVPTVPHVCVCIYMVWQEKMRCQILGFFAHTYQICTTAEI